MKNNNLEVKNQQTISKMSRKRLKYYKDSIKEHKNLAELLSFMQHILDYDVPEQTEMKHEILESKKTFLKNGKDLNKF